MILAVYDYRLFSPNGLGRVCSKRRMLGNRTGLDFPAMGIESPTWTIFYEILFFRSNL